MRVVRVVMSYAAKRTRPFNINALYMEHRRRRAALDVSYFAEAWS